MRYIVTPSASHLVTSSRSLSLKIYTLRASSDGYPSIEASLTKALKPHATPVVTAAIDSSGTLLATGSADGTIKVWDIRGGYSTHTFHGHNGLISALLFFHTPQPDPAKNVKVNKKGISKSHSQKDVSTDVSQDQTTTIRLASGGEDGKIRIWNLARRKSIAVLDSHVSVVRGLDFSLDDNALVSVGRDKIAIIWDALTWKPKKTIPILERIEAVGFLQKGRVVYTGGERGCLRLWNAQTGTEWTDEQAARGEAYAIVHMIHNPQQHLILTVNARQTMCLHSASSIPSPSTLSDHILPLPIIRCISGNHDEIIDLGYAMPDCSLLALAANSEEIRLVSLKNSSTVVASPSPSEYFGADIASLEGHSDIIICLAIDSTGHWLATGSKDNTARLWRIDSAKGIYQHHTTFTGHTESLGAIALPDGAHSISSDGPPLFLLTGSQDRTIKRWSIPKTLSKAKALYTRKAHDKDINAISISPSSLLFASASQDRTVKIWSIDEGETQGILRGHKRGVWSVVFAPKDTLFLPAEQGGSASSNRGLILTGSGDRTLKIWSLNDYTCLRTFEGHTNSVLKVLWLPPPSIATSTSDESHLRSKQNQQSTIASAGSDGLVKIWSPVSGECLATLDNHTDRIWALAFNPATRTLVSGGGDGVVTFWKDTSRETAAEKSKAAVERVEQDQDLRNCEREGRWREGIVLALQLNHPARLLGLFERVVDTSPPEAESISGVKAVDEVLASLSDEQLLSLLLRVRDWNTNARTAPVAQRILNVIVRSYSAQKLAVLGKRKGGKEVIEALRVYTERHYRRTEELWGESWIVEFLLGQMEQLGVKDGVDGVTKRPDDDMIML